MGFIGVQMSALNKIITHRSMKRSMLKVVLRHKVPNNKVRWLTVVVEIMSKFKILEWNRARHIARMNNNR